MLLIDGHNLIGKMPNVSLSDPDDELKLLRALENYHAMHPHEAMLVVFDPGRGRNGGWSNMRSSVAGIAVRFAPRGSSADAVIARIVREDKNPRSITVVSSDNAVRKAARERGARTLTSEDFVAKLRERYNPRRSKLARFERDTSEKPAESDAEYWAQFFKEPKSTAPNAKRPADKAVPFHAPARPEEQGAGAGDKPGADRNDVDYWLSVFAEPDERDVDSATPTPKHQTANDIEYWLKEFTRKRE